MSSKIVPKKRKAVKEKTLSDRRRGGSAIGCIEEDGSSRTPSPPIPEPQLQVLEINYPSAAFSSPPDLRLTFRDGPPLFAHSIVLSTASTYWAKRIREVQEEQGVDVPSALPRSKPGQGSSQKLKAVKVEDGADVPPALPGSKTGQGSSQELKAVKVEDGAEQSGKGGDESTFRVTNIYLDDFSRKSTQAYISYLMTGHLRLSFSLDSRTTPASSQSSSLNSTGPEPVSAYALYLCAKGFKDKRLSRHCLSEISRSWNTHTVCDLIFSDYARLYPDFADVLVEYAVAHWSRIQKLSRRQSALAAEEEEPSLDPEDLAEMSTEEAKETLDSALWPSKILCRILQGFHKLHA